MEDKIPYFHCVILACLDNNKSKYTKSNKVKSKTLQSTSDMSV